MKLLIYSAKEFEIPFLKEANKNNFRVTYCAEALDTETAIKAMGFDAVSIFSADDASSIVLEKLWDLGVRHISIRAAGYNNINLKIAKVLGFKVANAPDYSPHAIAEHATALLLAFNRHLIQATINARNYNFLQDDLMGFNLKGKTVGIIGTGRIGSIMAKIMFGYGCKILANDLTPDYRLIDLYNVSYTSLDELCRQSDIISLHIPLNSETYYLIDEVKLALMKPNTILINTARGAVVDTKALIKALEENRIRGYCTDVYEKEKGVFFRNNSNSGLKDQQLKNLLSLPNVLLTPHQAFVTREALANIAKITFENLRSWAENKPCKNELGLDIISL